MNLEPPEVSLPDDTARDSAVERLATLDLPGAGFGALTDAIGWAAATQASPRPTPFPSVRVVVLAGDHAGGVAAGDAPLTSRRRARQALAGAGPLARLAARAGATLEVVDVALAGEPLASDSTTRIRDGAAPIETQDAADAKEIAAGYALGRLLADSVADAGVDLVVLASVGSGAQAAAAAVTSFFTGEEPAVLLGRVAGPDGAVDDAAWMTRCAAVRDALHRVRSLPRDPESALVGLGGPDLAAATGLVLGAAARRTPVVLDGPMGLTAALLARDLAGAATHWCLAPDTSRQPTAVTVAQRIGLDPFVDLRLDLGEGAAGLTGLTLLQSALDLVSTAEQTTAEPAADAANP